MEAVKHIEHEIDAVDINFGCPQNIAKRGHYGAFLLDDVDLMCSLIRKLYEGLSIGICAKIRILPDTAKTVEMCRRLEQSGCSIITVHGRTVQCKKDKTGDCDFEVITAIKSGVNIPIFANGGCETMSEVMDCLSTTKCDGYMAAESLLTNPAMFHIESESEVSDRNGREREV